MYCWISSCLYNMYMISATTTVIVMPRLYYVMLFYVTLYYVSLWYARFVTLYYVTLWCTSYVTLYYVALLYASYVTYITLHYGTPVTLRYITLHSGMLVTLRYITLHYYILSQIHIKFINQDYWILRISQVNSQHFSWNFTHTIFHSCRVYPENFTKLW